MDTIFQFFLDKYPYIIIAIIVVFTVFFAVRYHYTQVAPAKKSSKESCDRLDVLPCGKHEDNIKNVDGTLTKLNDSVESVKDLLTEVTKWIMRFDTNTIDVFMKKNSPYQLTNVGIKILNESKGKETIDNNIDFFINLIESYNPRTAFDVEDRAMDVILNNIGNDIFDDVKNYVYYSPEKKDVQMDDNSIVEIKISMPPLIRSMSIYLRDKYFDKYPEIEDSEWKKAMNGK